MAVASAVVGGDDALSALTLGGVMADVRPGAVILVAGDGEDELAHALAAYGAVVHRPIPGGDRLPGDARPALVVIGDATPDAIAGPLEQAHAAGCPFAYCRREAALAVVRRWYWCHQLPTADTRLPTLGETLRGPAAGSAPAAATRYGHWVGWRRMLPAEEGSPRTPAAPSPAP